MSDRPDLAEYYRQMEINYPGYGGGADEPPVATQPMPKAALALEPTAPAPEQPYAYPYLGDRAIPTAAPAPVQSPQPTAAPVGQPAPQPTAQPTAPPPPVVPGRGRGTLTPNYGYADPRGKIPLIRQAFAAEGVDPDTAVKVASTEGLSTYSSRVVRKDGTLEPSFGAFQFYMEGGLGNEFQKATGKDPRDPANEDDMIRYAAKHVKQNGWGAFHGARKVGIGDYDGIPNLAGNAITPQAVQKTIQSGDPMQTLTLLRQTLPGPRFSDTDRFAALEAWAVGRLLADGKPDEAEKMQDAITRVSHAGVNSHMMEAMAALKRGDLQGTARHLDISYAFAPDGASGKFFTDGKGKLYAQTVDEKTGTPLDKPFEVTPEAIEGQLKFTKNPVTYLKTLGERQKQVAEARRADEQAAYYRDRNKTSLQVAGVAAAGAQTRQAMAGETSQTNQIIRSITELAKGRSMAGAKDPLTGHQIQQSVDKEMETLTPPSGVETGTPAHGTWNGKVQAIALSMITNASKNGQVMAPKLAASIAAGLSTPGGTYAAGLTNKGTYAVYDKNGPKKPDGTPYILAEIDKDIGDALQFQAQTQAPK